MEGKNTLSEKKIEAELVKKVKEVGGWALKLLPFQYAGLPDRVCLFPGGRILFVELKAPGEKPSAVQVSVHRKLRALGFTVVVIDSKEAITDLMIQT